MNTSHVTKSLFVGIILLSMPAFAKETKASRLVREPVTSETASKSEVSYGLGLAAVEGLTNTSTAFTGTIELSRFNLVQAFVAIDSTSPIGRLNLAGLFKHSVFESENAGFHIGAGAGIGNVYSAKGGVFGFTVAGVAGIHLNFPGVSHVKIHLDGGPQFTVVDSDTNFSFKALSPALGLSVIYQI